MPDTPPPDPERLDPEQLAAYFALMEVGSLLQHAVDQQLRDEGGLSYTQFQILAVLGQAPEGQLRMTDIADRLVHSRSGLTYQVAQLAKAGLVTRAPSADDERSVNVTATPQGQELLGRVMPGHVAVVRRLLVTPLNRSDITTLSDVLGRVRTHIRTTPPRSATPGRKPTTLRND
ncbi:MULTISPECIES: MarR family winged helix-turn-helix transcriptional regulator [Streptomyces]|uniref:MarR family winged helix-turn-helix transcriptional regulator n=1 Tax=Streptomyces TaxID=1883 RepID=UPI000C1A9230|nr:MULTISPECIES: MarR family transcriptional regulator [Streptomyces]GHD60313.1 MarR family transcriptional regulator [Streptomyces mirabilis]